MRTRPGRVRWPLGIEPAVSASEDVQRDLGWQKYRTGTRQDPVPREVYPCMPAYFQAPDRIDRGHRALVIMGTPPGRQIWRR